MLALPFGGALETALHLTPLPGNKMVGTGKGWLQGPEVDPYTSCLAAPPCTIRPHFSIYLFVCHLASPSLSISFSTPVSISSSPISLSPSPPPISLSISVSPTPPPPLPLFQSLFRSLSVPPTPHLSPYFSGSVPCWSLPLSPRKGAGVPADLMSPLGFSVFVIHY